MTNNEKLNKLRILLDDGGELPTDEKLNAYLSIAESEILAWMYHLSNNGVPDYVVSVPQKYENVQIYAVIAGYTHAGAEGQDSHIENGVHRNFMYADMLDYIHNNVLPIARVGTVSAS